MGHHPVHKPGKRGGKSADQLSRTTQLGDAADSDDEHNVDLEAQDGPVSPTSPVSPAGDGPPIKSPRKQNTFDSTARKIKRSKTAKVYAPKVKGRSWKPGQEPGIDPHWSHPARVPVGLKESCEITVVDFSQEHMEVQYLDNDSLEEFLEGPKPANTNCRWISVNGLSWDVISLLGRTKGFHRLAIEDMLNRHNRTKADWYSDHTYSKCELNSRM